MKKDMNNIKDKIQKLLSLSKSPNEHEAAMALQKAQDLLKKYNLSMEEVFSFTADNVREDIVFCSKKIPRWLGWLATVIAEIFNVQVYKSCEFDRQAEIRYIGRGIRFVGFEADLMVATHCFIYLKRGIEAGCRQKRAELKLLGMKYFPRNFKNAYALGYIEAVKEKMAQLARIQLQQEDLQATEQISNLPVVKQNAIEEYMRHLNLGTAKQTKIQLDHAVYMVGFTDGAKTSLSRPVSGAGLRAIA